MCWWKKWVMTTLKRGFKNEEFDRHTSVCHPKLGGTHTKNGTHLHKQKNFVKIWRLVLHDAVEELSLIVDRLRTRWRWTKPHRVEREVGDFLWHFPSRLHLHHNRYTTTQPQTFYNPPRSTPPPFFTQPAVRQLRRTSRFANSTTTDNNTLYTTTHVFDSFHQSQ